MLPAGRLDRRITLQVSALQKDAAGAPVLTWSDVATVWARYIPVGGREFYSAQAAQQIAGETARFLIRWRADLTARHRIVFDGKTWNIRNLAELGRREGLELTAEVIND